MFSASRNLAQLNNSLPHITRNCTIINGETLKIKLSNFSTIQRLLSWAPNRNWFKLFITCISTLSLSHNINSPRWFPYINSIMLLLRIWCAIKTKYSNERLFCVSVIVKEIQGLRSLKIKSLKYKAFQY